MKRLVSQFVKVILAAVNRPFGSRLILVDISSTRKSDILAFNTPPMPSEPTANPVKPIELARLSSTGICYTLKFLEKSSRLEYRRATSLEGLQGQHSSLYG